MEASLVEAELKSSTVFMSVAAAVVRWQQRWDISDLNCVQSTDPGEDES